MENIKAIIHAVWSAEQLQLILWVEDIRQKIKPIATTHKHPFVISASILQDWFSTVTLTPTTIVLTLPSSDSCPQPSLTARENGFSFPESDLHLADWEIEGVALSLDAIFEVIPHLATYATQAQYVLDDDVLFWQDALLFVFANIAQGNYFPSLNPTGNIILAQWRMNISQFDFQSLVEAMPLSACLEQDQQKALEIFLHQATDYFLRHIEYSFPIRQHDELAWALVLDKEGRIPAQKQQTLYSTWYEWHSQHIETPPFQLCLRLDEPNENSETDDWYVVYLLRATFDQGILIPLAELWNNTETYQYVEKYSASIEQSLMAQFGRLANVSPLVAENISTLRPTMNMLTTEMAYEFLVHEAPQLAEAGFEILIPDWWEQRAKLWRSQSSLKQMKEESLGFLSQNNLFQYEWSLAIGDVQVNRKEFEELVRLKKPLLQYKGQWIALDQQQVEATRKFLKTQPKDGTLNILEAMQIRTAPNDYSETDLADDLMFTTVAVDKSVEDYLQKFSQPQKAKLIKIPPELQATLRPYQEHGFSWLVQMRQMGLGACLADDMGLGKTIQTIALWLYERNTLQITAPALLVCPTSVVGNWQLEIKRFAPSLRVMAHHGAQRPREEDFIKATENMDVVLTSYSLLHRDLATLQSVEWDSIVLDEAQNIKNPVTKQAKAARSLIANFKLALTGTPIENRLSELWSIFQFLNPGYLGSRQRFTSRFATPIEKNADKVAAETLRQLIQPFILRRMKTDSKIIQDLPEKFETRVYCTLTSEQATLYEAVVQTELEAIARADNAMARRGSVLRMLIHLKQICNHPAHYLKQGKLDDRSGKVIRLTEILAQVMENGERALIFTQYARMGHLLQSYLQELLQKEILFLHGGTPGVKRSEMVESFQTNSEHPIFLLSLKAGGLGLNLTAATHVFHFDRWYNPAVETQATDRAYRIGQKQVVQVHKLICIGTLEERIDELIEHKKGISDQILGGSGEAWISEMSDNELQTLVALREDLVGV